MPVTPTYPGVYLEEIPSGVRTIVGVATSITAFLGRARRGPSNKPITISSFADFEQQCGKLHVDDPMGYAVRDFYMNGGGQAIIVRLFASPDATDGKSKLAVGNLQLEASSQGSWGNDLSVRADYNGIDDDSAAQFESFGLTKNDLFNLTVEDQSPAHSAEFFPNLSVKDGPRRIDRVLAQESQLIRVGSGTALPAARPAEGGSSPAAGGVDSAYLKDLDYQGDKNERTGIYALDGTDLVNLLCIPPDRPDSLARTATF